ncbi:MAG: hypothetical protein JXQ96_23550 [Cyclobacteriaceae bacterium]
MRDIAPLLTLTFILGIHFHILSQRLVLQNGHSKEIKVVRFSPTGQNMFSVGGDEKLKVYNDEGYLLKTFKRFKDEYLDGVFSADGQKLYLTSFLQDSVFRIDLTSLEVDQTVLITDQDSPFQAKGLALTDHGVKVLFADKNYEKEKADYQVIEISPDGTSKIVNEGGFVGDDYGSYIGPLAKRLIHYPYVDGQSKTVLLNIETDKVVKEFVGARPFKFTEDEKEIYELYPSDGDGLACFSFTTLLLVMSPGLSNYP